jgi:XRE family transcriptional regulator, fatty acid utilization regulator
MAQRLYVGRELRLLRNRAGLDQRAMAKQLQVSVSYLSQLENDQRPLSPKVMQVLRSRYPDVAILIEGEATTRRLTAVADALLPQVELPPAALARFNEEWPDIARRLVHLDLDHQRSLEQLQLVEETMAADAATRPPWEAVRDWFHDAGNYIDEIDRRAEALAMSFSPGYGCAEALQNRGVTLAFNPDDEAPIATMAGGKLTLSASVPAETRRFQMAYWLAAETFGDVIEEVICRSGLSGEEARKLLRVGLTNYGAGALVMPYAPFREAAREVRHDVDRLSLRFQVSFEQVCHRLSTLQRPGAEGLPVYFCRVDMAGNVTKRHSATRMQFARFGGSCPLWIVHDAIAVPDRILVQHAETPEGARYISMARGIVKASGRFLQNPRRYAVALGCEAVHADAFVYADIVDRATDPTPIGSSCRLCQRPACEQRAFPPIGHEIVIDPGSRRAVPYTFELPAALRTQS